MNIFSLRSRMLFLIPIIPVLGACSDSLVYGESTNFSLASVKVNSNIATPLSVNFALHRTVAAIVPAMDSGAEAANMVASFQLDDDGTFPFGTKTISTEFASGNAGEVMASQNFEYALHLMNAGHFTDDKYSRCIDKWVDEDETQREARLGILNTWSSNAVGKDNRGLLRHAEEYKAERKQFIEAHKDIPCT